MTQTRQRYRLKEPELDELTQQLLDKAREIHGSNGATEHVRQLIVTAIRLLSDGASTGDVKLLNNAFKEMRHSMRVFAPHRNTRKVAVFGSARTKPDQAAWKAAYAFSEKIVKSGWMVITGAGPGIMEAAQGGAGRKRSFGVNIRLPFEQDANETIRGDHKLINFRYFFTRKVAFVRESHAIVLFPGGFGTHDEGMEALTLIQTGKSELCPVVFVDDPGGSYWKDWLAYVRKHLAGGGLISPDDLHLFKVTEDIDEAIAEILNYYSNYHSSRYVGDRLVLRVRTAPDAETLERLNSEYSDILAQGRIEVGSALPEEGGEAAALPRILLHFDRRRFGRLRLMIDELNTLVAEGASSPAQASPHEIRENEISRDAAEAQEED